MKTRSTQFAAIALTSRLSSFPKTKASRSVIRSGVAALSAVCLTVSVLASAHAQTDTPNVVWQRGMGHLYPNSLTWAGNDLIYMVTLHPVYGSADVPFIDAYRASDLTYVRGVKAFSVVNYNSAIITSTGYPGHVVIAAVGNDAVTTNGTTRYTPHLRLYNELLTQIGDVDLSAQPGSLYQASSNYSLFVAFSADGNRLAVSVPTGTPNQTLYFDSTYRESGALNWLGTMPGIRPMFPTDDRRFTLANPTFNWTDYLWVDLGGGQLQSYSRNAITDVKAYYPRAFENAHLGNGYALGFSPYKTSPEYDPWFLNSRQMWNPASYTTPSSSGSGSTLLVSPVAAGSNFNYGYTDSVTKLIRWNGEVLPNERLFIGGAAYPSTTTGNRTGAFAFVQVYDMDYPSAITSHLSVMQVQTDPALAAGLQSFTPSFDSNNVAMVYSTGDGTYLQVRGIHNEVMTSPEIGGNVLGAALSPDGSVFAKLEYTPKQLDLYRTSDGQFIRSLPLAQTSYPTDHVQFSQDGNHIAVYYYEPAVGTGTSANIIAFYRVSDGALENTLNVGSQNAIALSPDLSIAAVTSQTTNGVYPGVSFYRTATNTLIGTYSGRFPLAFSPDSSAFVAPISTGKIGLRNINTGTLRWMADVSATPQVFAFSPDGSTIAQSPIQATNNTVKIIRASDGAVTQTITTPLASYNGSSLDPAKRINFLPNGALFTIDPANTIHLWDSVTGAQLRNYQPANIGSPTYGISEVTVAPNGQYFGYVTDQNFVSVAKAPYYGQNVLISPGRLTTATRNGSTITVTVSLKNSGGDTADVLTVTQATLGTASTATTSTLPLVIGNVAEGNTKTIRLTFPASAVSSNSNSVANLRLIGTCIGGSFNLLQQIVVP